MMDSAPVKVPDTELSVEDTLHLLRTRVLLVALQRAGSVIVQKDR